MRTIRERRRHQQFISHSRDCVRVRCILYAIRNIINIRITTTEAKLITPHRDHSTANVIHVLYAIPNISWNDVHWIKKNSQRTELFSVWMRWNMCVVPMSYGVLLQTELCTHSTLARQMHIYLSTLGSWCDRINVGAHLKWNILLVSLVWFSNIVSCTHRTSCLIYGAIKRKKMRIFLSFISKESPSNCKFNLHREILRSYFGRNWSLFRKQK